MIEIIRLQDAVLYIMDDLLIILQWETVGVQIIPCWQYLPWPCSGSLSRSSFFLFYSFPTAFFFLFCFLLNCKSITSYLHRDRLINNDFFIIPTCTDPDREIHMDLIMLKDKNVVYNGAMPPAAFSPSFVERDFSLMVIIGKTRKNFCERGENFIRVICSFNILQTLTE